MEEKLIGDSDVKHSYMNPDQKDSRKTKVSITFTNENGDWICIEENSNNIERNW